MYRKRFRIKRGYLSSWPFVLVFIILASLTLGSPIAAQSSLNQGLGVGEGDGPEIGINLANLQAIQNDINNGVYDRPCTEPEHDPTKWHTLVNVELKCHYDHQHGDDPNYVNDIFGEPGDWFGDPGQSISYPWQTFKAAVDAQPYVTPSEAGALDGGMENQGKHEGYYWVVRRDQPCNTPNGLYCVKDFRLEFHSMMVGAGAATRWHSFSAEVRACRDVNDLSSCGIIRTGGWIDMGRLYTSDPTKDANGRALCGPAALPDNLLYIPLPVDSQFRPLSTDGLAALDEERCHPLLTPQMIAAGPSLTSTSDVPMAQWWGHGGTDFRFQLEVMNPLGNVYETSPGSGQLVNQLFCSVDTANCDWNQSIFTARLQYIVPVNSAVVEGFASGDRVNLPLGARYVTRFGKTNAACTGVSLDCIPIEYSNLQLNAVVGTALTGYSHTPCGNCQKVDYDLSPAGNQWITWFYKKFAGYTPPPTTEPQPETPTGPAAYFQVDDSTAGQANVNLQLIGVSGVYGIQAECAVDPQILQGTQLTEGEFNSDNSFIIDDGFGQDGVWRVAASRLGPSSAIEGDNLALTLHYNVLANGDGQLHCSALVVDEDGKPIDLNVVNGSVLLVPDTEPPVEDTGTDSPPIATGALSGMAHFQNRPDQSGIKVQLFEMGSTMLIGDVLTNNDGTFNFSDLAIGDYQLQATAPQHIPVLASVTISDPNNPVQIDVQLRAGDVDGDGKVTIDDILLVAANFDLPAQPAISNLVLNEDGTINISDLTLTSGNLDLESPLLNTTN